MAKKGGREPASEDDTSISEEKPEAHGQGGDADSPSFTRAAKDANRSGSKVVSWATSVKEEHIYDSQADMTPEEIRLGKVRSVDDMSPTSPMTPRSPSVQMGQLLAAMLPNRLYRYSLPWVQWTLPVLIVLNIALFLWSNLSIGASVIFTMRVPQTSELAITFTSQIPSEAGAALMAGAPPQAADNSSALVEPMPVGSDRLALVCQFISEPLLCLSQAIVQTVIANLEDAKQTEIVYQSEEGSMVSFSVFDFSLGSSVTHMWNGGAYALAVLIAILSGAWPYIKLCTMLLLWVLRIKPNKRGNCLAVLEALGKWSLIDIYVFALMMAGFRLVLNAGAIAIDIAIEARWGIYSFCIGVLLSHFLSHVMHFLHSNAQGGLHEYTMNVAPTSLCSHSRIRHKKVRVWAQVAVALAIVGVLALTVASVTINTFKFTFSGIIGMLLPKDDQVRMYSLAEAGQYIPSMVAGTSLATKIGDYFVVVVYYAFALVTPILQLVFAFLLWVLPLTMSQKQAMHTTTSVMGSWSALDVFFISVIACIAEIGRLTSSLMGETCDRMKEGIGIDCVRLDASFMNGCWLIAVAVVTSFLVCRFVLYMGTYHFRRVSMIHLLHMAGKDMEELEPGTPELIKQQIDHFQSRTFSTRLAEMLTGSVKPEMSFRESELSSSAIRFVKTPAPATTQ